MNRLVLIADGQPGRGRLLAAACRASGMASKMVTHGAAALELALSAQPALIVAQLDLPLVDGFKLAEILRANPRTRGVRFLFLTEEEGRLGELGAIGDELVIGSVGRDEMVARIGELIERQDRIDSLDAATQGGGRVEGELAQTSLADLLQLFHLSQRSGHIEVKPQDELDGRPLEMTGLVALHEGDVTRAAIGETQGEKALFRMLRWRAGHFVFEPGHDAEPPEILMSTGALLVEGMRQSAEWERMALEFPPLDAEVRLRVSQSELPNIVHPLTQEVLLLVEMDPSVGDVVDQCSYPDYQVLRTLHTLSQREIVKIRQAPIPAAVAERAPRETTALLDDVQVRRLREWMEGAGLMAAGGHPARAKLVVAGSDAGAILDFAHLFDAVDGAQLDAGGAVRGADRLAGDLFSLGRIAIDDQAELELVHVPVDARFAPVWPVAGHGALATVFLLHGPVGAAAERVRAMNETLAGARSRIFHVVLLGKGERVSPDELRENVSLIDESSVFLLPLESAKEPTALLRSLFARIVGGASAPEARA